MKKIFQGIVAMMITLLFMEVFFRFTHFISPTLTEYDEEFGTSIRKNFLWVKFKEGFFIGSTNEFGIMHEDGKPKSKKSDLRIGLIGDSFVMGDDVFSRHHFGSIFENVLNDHYQNKNIDVINFGRGNFSMPASFYYYDNYIKDFELDYIIYFLEARDYQDTYPRFVKYYSLNEKGELQENLAGAESFQFKLFKYLKSNQLGSIIASSSMPALLSRVMYMIDSRGITSKLFGKFRDIEILLNLKSEDEKSSAWYNPYTLDKQELPEFTKYVINDLEKENRPNVIFVTRHHPVKVPQLDKYFEERGSDYISLNSIFNGTTIIENGKDGHFFKTTNSYGGHFNHDGHKATGKYLARKFIEISER